jgi:hypothetical protein
VVGDDFWVPSEAPCDGIVVHAAAGVVDVADCNQNRDEFVRSDWIAVG